MNHVASTDGTLPVEPIMVYGVDGNHKLGRIFKRIESNQLFRATDALSLRETCSTPPETKAWRDKVQRGHGACEICHAIVCAFIASEVYSSCLSF